MLESLFRLVQGLGFHVWKATTLRPTFVHQTDSAAALAMLYVLLLLVSLGFGYRLSQSELDTLMGAGHFLSSVIPVKLICESQKSRLPAINGIAAMVGLTFPEWLMLNGVEMLDPEPSALVWIISFGFLALRFYAAHRILNEFLAMPPYVQKPGYKPSSEGNPAS